MKAQFRAELLAAGLQPIGDIIPGEFARMPGVGKTNGNRAGWCLLFANEQGGIFGDWSTGVQHTWQAEDGTPLSPAELKAVKKQIAEEKKQSAVDRKDKHTAARKVAEALWVLGEPATAEHPYLKRKGIQPYDARVYRGKKTVRDMDCHGALMLPMYKDDEISSLQFINGAGEKRYLPGGEIGAMQIGVYVPGQPRCIAESFSTGASIAEATGYCVSVAFDAGHLAAVAEMVLAASPDAQIILCADDDHKVDGNPGVTKATEAAQVVGGMVAVPVFGGDRPDKATDFNNMAALSGLAAVKRVIDAALNSTTPKESDEEVIRRLALLSQMDYDRVRKEQATALKVQIKTLDAMVKAARDDEGEADRLPFAEVEPHHEPIDPAQLLDEVAKTIQLYVVLDREQAWAAALWIAFSWFIDVVEVAPLAIITAPEKSCGKSQLLFVIKLLACRPLAANNMLSATLFRIAEKWHPAILIDEADGFIKTDENIAGIINAGHTRDAAFVWRLVGDNFEPKSFNVWGAKALTGINMHKHLTDATMSRGIIFELRRKLPHEMASRLRHADKELFEPIAAKLARFAEDYSEQVRLARPLLPDALSDREQDNWEPLLAIAACAGAEWSARATEAALALSGATDKSGSIGNELLTDIRRVFELKKKNVDDKHKDRIKSADLVAALCTFKESKWNDYSFGKSISQYQLAKLLKPYKIKTKSIKFAKDTTYHGFELEQFSDVFLHYLEPTPPKTEVLSETPKPSNAGAGLRVSGTKKRKADKTTSETRKPTSMLGGFGVSDKKPISMGGRATHPKKQKF